MSEVSKLRFYSIGTVAANKELSSKEIEVTPIEDLPMVDGEISDAASKTTASAQDVQGGSYQTELVSSVTIKATWLPISNSNRMTAPDVRRGETVVLYRFADDDKFWWNTLRNDMHLRKLETVVWGISGTKDEAVGADAKSMYYIEFSSHRKLIHIHTSSADGEKFEYDIQINTGEGFVQIQDDDGQVFRMDSNKRQLVMQNRDNSFINIEKKKIHLNASEEVRVTTAKYIVEASTSAALTTPANKIEATTTHTGAASFTQDVNIAGKSFLQHIHVETSRETLPPS